MAAYYDSIKSMKTAKIGTILPWGGDGGNGFLASNIPKGWIVCDGSTKDAKDYPLLASILGDTCLLYTSPSPRDRQKSRMPSSA